MIAHQSLPELVRLTLRRRILNNELAAGERLTEASLAAEFGVSRTTLRSALTALQNDRLVEFSPRRGCWVARMTRAEIEDACYARYLLESGAMGEERAVIDDTLLAALGLELDAMARAVDSGDLGQVIDRHRSLIEPVATRDRAHIAAALKDHYLNPKSFADSQPGEEEAS